MTNNLLVGEKPLSSDEEILLQAFTFGVIGWFEFIERWVKL